MKNNLVDRYIYDVVRRLPEGERADVERELAANIRDMLPEGPDEAAVVRVLESLGEPRKLAEQYRANPRYLISPAMFERYIAAVRVILPVAAAVIGLVGLVIDLAEAAVLSFAGAIASVLSHALSAAMTALFVTTLGFAIADHVSSKGPSRTWSVRDLPDLPQKTAVRIPRSETIAGMVFGVALIACTFAVLKNPQLIGWYEPAKAAVPVFMPEAVSRYAPFFVFVSLLSLAVSCAKLILGRWTYPLAAIHTGYSVIAAVVFLLFLSGEGTFNPAVAEKIQQMFAVPPDQLRVWGRTGLIVWMALIALFTAVDVGKSWHKAYRGRRTGQAS